MFGHFPLALLDVHSEVLQPDFEGVALAHLAGGLNGLLDARVAVQLLELKDLELRGFLVLFLVVLELELPDGLVVLAVVLLEQLLFLLLLEVQLHGVRLLLHRPHQSHREVRVLFVLLGLVLLYQVLRALSYVFLAQFAVLAKGLVYVYL